MLRKKGGVNMAVAVKRKHSYLIKANLGYKNGKPRIVTREWKIPDGMTPSDADKKAQKIAKQFEEVSRRMILNNPKLTLEEYVDFWIGCRLPNLKLEQNIKAIYKRYAAMLKNSIGHIKMKDVAEDTLNGFISSLREQPHFECKYKICEELKKIASEQSCDAIASKTHLPKREIKTILCRKQVSEESASLFADAFGYELPEVFDLTIKILRLSVGTVQDYRSFLHILFNCAKYDKVVSINPMDKYRNLCSDTSFKRLEEI